MRPTTRLLAGGAAALGAGILAVGPLSAAARDHGDGSGWVQDVLSGLVDDGTLTQDQADAVAGALKDARPDHLHGPFFAASLLDDAAGAIGVDDDELLDALRDGETIAELAREKGVDPQHVINSMVDAVKTRLDEAVANGHLDKAAAKDRLDAATDRITEFVNQGFELRERLPFPRPGGGWLRHRWEHGGRWDPWDMDEDHGSPANGSTGSTPDTPVTTTTVPATTSPGGD